MGGEELLRKESRKECWKGGESLFFLEGGVASRNFTPRTGGIGSFLRNLPSFLPVFSPFHGEERGRVALTSRNLFLLGKSTGGREDFGRRTSKYVNIFPVEEDPSKACILDRRSKRNDVR